MMADETKNEETVTAETQNAVTNEQPAVADTPSEAADNQSAAQGGPFADRSRTFRRENRGRIMAESKPKLLIIEDDEGLQAQLKWSYDDFEVLRDITLDIPAGRIVCIVGPSGCGKSTLLRMIAGLEKITGGELQIPTKPGWGVDLDEEVARAHVWQPGRGPGF